jgi:CheY-like chemotaxis protein
MRPSLKDRIALVVEDDWFIREDIPDQFRQEGWRVLEAATGAEALGWLGQGHNIDVLVTDIRLADSITGWDVAKAVRIMHPDVLVIYASGGSVIDGRRVVDSVSLSKPMTAHDLLSACSKLRSRSSAGLAAHGA